MLSSSSNLGPPSFGLHGIATGNMRPKRVQKYYGQAYGKSERNNETHAWPCMVPRNCATHKFSNNELFQRRSDFPTMGSSLHRTHDTDGSLSIAFVSSPAEFESWISWAIIPTGSDRVGVQSLISFKQTDGSMIVKSYGLSHYQSVEQRTSPWGSLGFVEPSFV
ncbi:hypothetical protein AAG906_015709 [Vitis piasezkii]